MNSPALAFVFASLLVSAGVCAEEAMTDGKPPSARPPGSAAATVPTSTLAPAKPVSRAAEILKRFDKNGDGKLDDDEKADAHETMLQEQMAKEATTAFSRGLGVYQALALELFDRNHDGRLDENERLDALAFVQQRTDGAMREALLKRFDRNNDGKLDDAERRESENYAEEHRGELMQEVLLKRFDKNANGELDPDEKTTIREAFAAPVAVAKPPVSPAGAPEENERAAVQKYFQGHGADLFRAEVLKRFDANANGQLDPEERRTMQDYARDHPGEILRAVMLRRFDQNGDGRLDETERAAMREVVNAAAPAEATAAPPDFKTTAPASVPTIPGDKK